MKISRHWCNHFLSASLPAVADLSVLLTARGLEVEEQTSIAPVRGVVKGKVLSCQQHPHAESLNICVVDIGQSSPTTIVCGAPNIRSDMLVAVANVGACLGGQQINRRDIHGVDSAGMICSANEIGLGEDDRGILELTADEGGCVGEDLSSDLFFNDDVLTVNVTPNRGDWLSHLGVARELAAATSSTLQSPTPLDIADMAETMPIDIDESARESCPYYSCLVIRDVDCARPSPAWLRTLIERCGCRSVSVVVDITNYLMLAFGQPLHAFDVDQLSGAVHVRYAAAGESVTLLDGTVAVCADSDLLIADEASGIALAGVMGGLSSGVTAATKNILIEAAFFSPTAVCGVARRLNLNSAAAFRFERGVDSHLPLVALTHAGRWVKKLCGGSCGQPNSAGQALPIRHISVPIERVHRLLGTLVTAPQARDMLNQHQISTVVEAANQADDRAVLQVAVPPWRFDLKEAVNVMGEIARLSEYDKLPATLPVGGRDLSLPSPAFFSSATARSFLVAHGFFEVITYSFVPSEWERQLSSQAALPLQNPMSEEMAVMRTTLWGGLLDRAKFNVRHRQERVRLFEVGHCFLPSPTASLPDQPVWLGGIALGSSDPIQWSVKKRLVDFYDIKGLLETLVGQLMTVDFRPLPPNQSPAVLHPGKAANIFYQEECIGQLGQLHPAQPLAEAFKEPPFLFSLNMTILGRVTPSTNVDSISHLPLVWRDISVLVNQALPVGEVLSCARQAAPWPVREIQLFDFYAGHGDNIGVDQKSCALRLFMQGNDANLVSDTIDRSVSVVLDALRQQCQARLRDG